MQFFNIRDIENLTGIKAHTLRTWEKRYGIIMPLNTPGKHRMYDNNDLKQILRISTLYHGGYKISKIAGMSLDEMSINTLQLETKTNFEVFINRFIEFTVDLNEAEFKKLFSELRESIDEKIDSVRRKSSTDSKPLKSIDILDSLFKNEKMSIFLKN